MAISAIEYVNEQIISPKKKSPNSTGKKPDIISLIRVTTSHFLVCTTLSQYGIRPEGHKNKKDTIPIYKKPKGVSFSKAKLNMEQTAQGTMKNVKKYNLSGILLVAKSLLKNCVPFLD